VVFGAFFATGGAGSEEEASSAASAYAQARINEAKTSELIRRSRKLSFFHRISFMRLENWPILYQLPVITKVGKQEDLLAADVLQAGHTFRRLSRHPVNRHKIS